MLDYKIQLNGKKLPEGDEEIMVTFLKMLDFAAEYLSSIYDKEHIRFCPEMKKILICDSKKHENEIDEIADSYGFKLEIQ